MLNGNIEAANLASNAVTTAKITDASVTDAKLASPNNSAYRTIHHSYGMLANDAAAATYMLGAHNFSGAGATPGLAASGAGLAITTGAFSYPASMFYFDDADYTVGSLTQKLRLRAQVACNATQAAITFTFGLYPVTVAGSADTLALTLGTVVSSSTVAIASPSASTVTSSSNSDFTIPSDGAYALGVVTSAQLTNNSAVSLHAQLQTRSV